MAALSPSSLQILTSEKKTTAKKPTSDRSSVSAFEEVWKIYPRKVGKAAARKAFMKALDSTTFDTLMAALRDFAENAKETDPQFIPHLSTWLNQGRWEDDQSHARNRPMTTSEKVDIWANRSEPYVRPKDACDLMREEILARNARKELCNS